MRRSVLAACVLLVLAGCVGSPTTGTPGSPGHRVEVFDASGSGDRPIRGGIAYPEGGDGGGERFYVTVVGSTEDATRFDREVLPADATRFVDGTDFEAAFLVVVQAFPASSVPDYRVESVSRDGGTLRVRVNDSSDFGTDDVTLETVLLRVAGTPPRRVVVTTEDGFEFATGDGVVVRTPRDG